jgi:uncharacterized membrane protein
MTYKKDIGLPKEDNFMAMNNQSQIPDQDLTLPDAGSCYGHAWRKLGPYFGELFLIFIVMILLSIPTAGMSIADEMDWYRAFPLFLFSLAYAVAFLWPLEYGVSYAYLKAARGEKVEVKDMFASFQNYGNAILAHLLTGFVIGIGFLFFIIPGIIFACKLAFVPYLIVDKKMDALQAFSESWRMTTGHAMTVFLIGFISIFIALAGLICFLVGIIPASMWISLAFASLFVAVEKSQTEESTQKQ